MYKKLSNKLQHSEIKQLLNEAQLDVAKHYATNKKTLADFIKDYNGTINFKRIREYIHTKTFPMKNMEVGLYKTQQVPHKVCREMYEITNSNIGETRTRDENLKQQRREMFKSGIEQLRKANDVIRSINNKPNEGEKWLKKDEINKKKNVKSGNRVIEFNIEELDEPNRDYLHKHFGKFFMKLLDKIKINSSQRWMVCYKLGGKYECSTLNIRNIGTLLHQLKSENFIQAKEAETAGILELHYDFFLTHIRNLSEIKMYDLTEYEGLTMNDIKKGTPKARKARDESELSER